MKFIKARYFRAGRRDKVIYIVIHTAEGARTAKDLGAWFARTQPTNRRGSSHVGVGQTGDVAQYVRYQDTAFTNPPVNDKSVTVEVCGFARWSTTEWLAHDAMLNALAEWMADMSEMFNIPLTRLTDAQVGRGMSGVTTHVDINKVWGQSSHTDPGPNFPMDHVLKKASALLKATNPTPVDAPYPGHRFCIGDKGEHVRTVQLHLGVRPTGQFGPLTKAAVIKFQKLRPWTWPADGIVGPKTYAAILKK